VRPNARYGQVTEGLTTGILRYRAIYILSDSSLMRAATYGRGFCELAP